MDSYPVFASFKLFFARCTRLSDGNWEHFTNLSRQKTGYHLGGYFRPDRSCKDDQQGPWQADAGGIVGCFYRREVLVSKIFPPVILYQLTSSI